MSKKLKSLIASGLAVLNMGAVFNPVVGAYHVPLVSKVDVEKQRLINDFKEFKHRVDDLLNRTVLQLDGNLNAWVEHSRPYGFVAGTVQSLEHCRDWGDFNEVFRSIAKCHQIPTGRDYDELPRAVEFVDGTIRVYNDGGVLSIWECVRTAKEFVALNAVFCLKNLVKRLCLENRGNNPYADLILKLSKMWTFDMTCEPTDEQLESGDDRWMEERKEYFGEIKRYCAETLNYFSNHFVPTNASSDPNQVRISNYILELLEMCREVPNLIDETGIYSY